MATIRQRTGRAKSWHAIVRRTVDGKKFERTKAFHTEKEAQIWSRNMELALDDPDRRSELTKDKSTVSDLIIRYVKEVDSIKPISMTKRYTLAFLTGCPIGDVRACDLRASDIINHCKRRQKLGAAPATVQHDVVYLRGVFGMAKPAWNVNVRVTAVDEAGYTLKKLSLVGKSTARTRRLDASEWTALSAYWDRVGAKTQATRIPIRDIV